MWHLLQKIRAKPVNVRKKILFITATSLTLIIFLVWASAFISGISQTARNNDERDSKNIFAFLHIFQNVFADMFEKASIDTSAFKASLFNSTNTYTREESN